MTESAVVSKRYDFVLLFDVKDGNPNGDPDADNMPRFDPETLHGLVTDVCLKRKIRNYVQITKHTELPEPLVKSSKKPPYKGDAYDIFIREGKVLNTLVEETSEQPPIIVEDHEDIPSDDTTPVQKETEAPQTKENKIRDNLCLRYYDVRTFGAVVSTGLLKGKAEGQIRGPVQLTFARSIDPIITLGHSITRCAVTDKKDLKKERTMGRKHTISYGLYKAYGFVSPNFAKQTHFSEKDLKILWEALCNIFDFDHSASRGLMATRRLIVFEHQSKYGNAQASKLFDLIHINRKQKEENESTCSCDIKQEDENESTRSCDIKQKEEVKPARSFDDYEVTIDEAKLPQGVRIIPEDRLY